MSEHGITGFAEPEQKIIDQAYEYAKEMHGEQRRKYTSEPYIHHPVAVARVISAETDCSHSVICAALMHDVVEDTAATHADILERFGYRIADLVRQVTDVSRPEDGNRAIRKAIDRQYLAGADAEAQTIKLADLIHNTFSIVEYDKKFAAVYLAEKAMLLHALDKGDRGLHILACDIWRHSANKIGLGLDLGI